MLQYPRGFQALLEKQGGNLTRASQEWCRLHPPPPRRGNPAFKRRPLEAYVTELGQYRGRKLIARFAEEGTHKARHRVTREVRSHNRYRAARGVQRWAVEEFGVSWTVQTWIRKLKERPGCLFPEPPPRDPDVALYRAELARRRPNLSARIR